MKLEQEVGYDNQADMPLRKVPERLADKALKRYENHLIKTDLTANKEEWFKLRRVLENRAKQKVVTELKITFRELDNILKELKQSK